MYLHLDQPVNFYSFLPRGKLGACCGAQKTIRLSHLFSQREIVRFIFNICQVQVVQFAFRAFRGKQTQHGRLPIFVNKMKSKSGINNQFYVFTTGTGQSYIAQVPTVTYTGSPTVGFNSGKHIWAREKNNS